jgi:parallel beta-helix repeat protein
MSITPSVAVDTAKKPIMPISNGKTLYVGGSGPNNYTRIQYAINDANDGDTVFVYDDSAPYHENIIVKKSINLIGEDRNTTIIDGGGYENVVYFRLADWVTIRGFTIQNSGTGIFLYYHTDHNTITGNIISNNEDGIYLSTTNNSITGNTILNNGNGIYLEGSFSSYNTIEGNTISNNIRGIYFHGVDLNTIKGNTISNNQYGIRLVPTFPDTPGAFPSDSVRNTVLKNNFIDNERHASFEYFLPINLNLWRQNYWGRPRILPKLIFGFIQDIPWFNIDWFPARKPYNIEGVI